ncbi:MAG: 4-amino-4-deoxychorismate lyase [Bacteroidetes bacterium SW_11_45_7]|nr:MAG: 4-amino-4-deoxychorismate lyase [Bacteroidetes bacterium SW_11_45_7]
MVWIIHNGNLQDSEQPFLYHTNRAFSYGDGIFETMRVLNGYLHLWESHRLRVISSLRILDMELPEPLARNRLPEQVHQLLAANGTGANARVRLSIYRQAGGLYSPTESRTNYTLEVMPLAEEQFVLNRKGLVIGTMDEPLKVSNKLASIKSTSALPYVYAGIHKQKEGVDDLLITNSEHHIIEGLSSNLFIVTAGALFTPSLKEGCVAGVMRDHIIELARQNGYEVVETSLNREAPLYAEELFLTNAVKGIRWAGLHGWHQYDNAVAQQLIDKLNSHVPEYATHLS